MRWFALTVAYDGTKYGGWQIQSNAPSIQQQLIIAIEKATGEKVHVQGSGRTDAGVHATGQVASIRLQGWNAPSERLVPAINRYLPRSIVVRSVQEVVEGFDAIRNATSKRYRYSIWNARVWDPLHRRVHWWVTRPLDVDAMRRAAEFLLGTHDFKAYETLGSPRKSSIRSIYDLPIQAEPHLDGQNVSIEIEADGFLYNMVRNIVGALCEVGLGRFDPSWVQAVLESKQRDSSSQTAPGQGLCLVCVRYPEHLFVPLVSQESQDIFGPDQNS
ncbi:tRNA pseudouridine(38-40) synthase TruA [Pirellulaceae bacterium SH467]|jgi:tRNA pseudouridine38-40 synthase